MISLKHEDHGYHTCYSEADAVKHEKMGWVRCDMEKEIEAVRKAKNLTREVEEVKELPRTKRKYTKKAVTDDASASN